MRLSLSVPSGFNLKSTIYSHGWYALPPFSSSRGDATLRRIFELSTGKLIDTEITEKRTGNKVELSFGTSLTLTAHEKKELKSLVRHCLRLDEDLSEFYHLLKKHKEFSWVYTLGAGRLLRSPTVFEDVVKMICTTNCSWALTEIMVGNFCTRLGKPSSDRVSGEVRYAFPSAEAIADTSEKFLRKEIRAGYRSPYLLELAKRVTKKELELESWRTNSIPTEDFFEQVRSVKGVGPYAAGNLLKLLGHYDYLAIDSWCRKKFFEKHRNGRKVSDTAIEKHYKQYGKWRGLVLWLDLTQYWYETEFEL